MAGNAGITAHLENVPRKDVSRDHVLLYSETPGRFIVTIDPKDQEIFEATMRHSTLAWVGNVTEDPTFTVTGLGGDEIIRTPVPGLKDSWKAPFKGLT